MGHLETEFLFFKVRWPTWGKGRGDRGGGQVRPCDFKFLTADYPPNKAPIATKLWENAFQTIPVISFFEPNDITKKIVCETLNGRLPPKDGSVRPQTLGKHVSGDSRHFIFQRRKCFRNFERPFTPWGWLLRLASNFGKTHFRRSPTFDFSTPKKNWRKKNRRKSFSSKPKFCFQQTAYFGGAAIFWTSPADPSRKMIPDPIIFRSLRLLAEG